MLTSHVIAYCNPVARFRNQIIEEYIGRQVWRRDRNSLLNLLKPLSNDVAASIVRRSALLCRQLRVRFFERDDGFIKRLANISQNLHVRRSRLLARAPEAGTIPRTSIRISPFESQL